MSEWQSLSSAGPRPRSLHCGVVVGGSFYVFGGYDGSARVNDLHRLDLASERWTHVAPAGTLAPSPRDRMVALGWKTDFYVFGGFDGTSRLNELWKFDTVRLVWAKIHDSDLAPSSRHSHSGVVSEGRLYILFGYDGNYRADIHAFDIAQQSWTAVAARGQLPRPRYRSSAVTYGEKIYVFGGHDGTRHLDDLFCFDLLTNCWTLVETNMRCFRTPPIDADDNQGLLPPARDSHTAVVHESRMLLFGGSSGVARNDFWEYRFAKNRWVQLTGDACGRFCHVAVVHADRMYVHAGYDGQHRLGDTAVVRVPENLALDCPPGRLLEDLAEMVGSETFADIRFEITESEHDPVSVIYGHRILLARCEFFRALFGLNMRERTQETIRLSDIAPATFRLLLEFIYTDRFLAPLSPQEAAEVFQGADRFGMDRLKTVCEQTILASINVENACAVLHSADTHAAALLREKALEFVLRHYDAVVKTSGFEKLAKTNVQLVLELIRRKS